MGVKMKHLFMVFNMSDIENMEIDRFINNLSDSFKEHGYHLWNYANDSYEIAISNFGIFKTPETYQTASAIIFSEDIICHNNAPYASADEIWNLGYIIDSVIIVGKNPIFSQFSIRTPLFLHKKLNYKKLAGTLINRNT